jgi:hypothetical protein
MTAFVQSVFEESDSLAEPYNGVGQSSRVAEEEVEHPANQ